MKLLRAGQHEAPPPPVARQPIDISERRTAAPTRIGSIRGIAALAARTTSPVWIDQGRSFGRPCMTGTRVQVAIIADLHAAGDSVEAIAREFGVLPAAIVAVLDWHRSQQPASWRAVWADELAQQGAS